MLSAIGQDLRYGLRAIRRDLAFFGFAAAIIGLGVGASTAVFSVMSPLLLKPLPFAEPERLVWIANGGSAGLSSVTSRTSNLRDYRELNQSFEQMTGYFAFFEYESYSMTGVGEPERLVGVGIAQDFLDVLGVQPGLGRGFVDEEAIWDGRPAAILTHGFWNRRFGADPAIVGRSITLNEIPTEIVGVLPAWFDFESTFSPGSRIDFLRPFPISDETDRWGNTLSMVGRLKPGVTVAAAQADLDRVNEQLRQADPERWGLAAIVTGLQKQISGGFRSAMFILAAAAAAVMLIACANLSNLLLARSARRHKEMSVRSVLGATRMRLIRQLLAESIMLALAGAAIGVGIAFVATRVVSSTSAVRIPLLRTVGIDATALMFTLAVAVVAGVLLGIVPALQISQGREHAAINDASRGSSESKRSSRAREVLVVVEVALSCVLLVGGGLLLRSFVTVLDVDLGFQPAGAVAWRVDTSRPFDDNAVRIAFYEDLVRRVQDIPGVEMAGLTDTLPLGRNRGWGLRAQGVTYPDGEAPGGYPRMIDSHYLQTMGVALLTGRHFTTDDTADSRQVIVLNESAAQRLYPGLDPIGQVALVSGREWEVVGVVADVRHRSLEEGSGLEMYMPYTQQGWGTLDLVVRSRMPEEALIPIVQAELRSADALMPTSDFRSLGEIVDRAVSPRRFLLMLLAAFAATALALASLGIYGVLSYSVSQRTAEIGIRMALGESSRRVRGRVMRRTLMLALVGVGIGAAGSIVVSRLIASMLFGVGPTDGVTFAGMAVLLLGVSALAGYIPARRASRTDPMEALRSS